MFLFLWNLEVLCDSFELPKALIESIHWKVQDAPFSDQLFIPPLSLTDFTILANICPEQKLSQEHKKF